MILAAPGVYYRHLEIGEVLDRMRARALEHIARHNSEVTASAEPIPALRHQVKQEFWEAQRKRA